MGARQAGVRTGRRGGLPCTLPTGSSPSSPRRTPPCDPMRTSVKLGIASAATLAILGPLGYFWQDSLVPSTYDMAQMGYADFGGGPATGHQHGSGGTSLTALTGPTTGTPDVAVTLTARDDKGRYTLNGQTPGPEIRARKGQLVQVTLVNDNVADGITLHWHGVDVPNAEDGVAGVTQDAVKPGQSHVYRFVAQDAGDLLVPLPPAVARAGAARAVRDAGGHRRRRAVGRRSGGGGAHVRRAADDQRGAGGVRADRTTGAGGPGAAGQHRRRAAAGVGLRGAVPGGGHRRARGARADRHRRPVRGRHRRRAGGPDVHRARQRGRTDRRRCRSGAGGRPRRQRRAAAPVEPKRHPRSAHLRHAGAARVRPGPGQPALRLPDRPADRLPRRQARAVVDDQRPPLPRRADVHGRAPATSSR